MKMFHQNTFINGRCGCSAGAAGAVRAQCGRYAGVAGTLRVLYGHSAGVAGALRALRALYGRCGRVKVMIMEWGDHLLSDTIGKKRYLIVQPL